MAVLLDTCVLVNALRNGLNLPPNSFISLITEAELGSLAQQWNWSVQRKRQLNDLLSELPKLAIDGILLDEYVRIDCYSKGKLPSDPLPPGQTARKMGKNDLWIAATAITYGMNLYTSDNDYDHLVSFGLKLVKVAYPAPGAGYDLITSIAN